jgi:membrane protein
VSAVDDSIAVLLDVVALARRERIVLTAGSVAYFTFISLVPLLLLLVAAVSLFGADVLVRRVVNRAARTLTPESADLLQEIVLGAASDEGATVVGAVVLFWGALLTFRALDTTFTGIYDTRGERSLLGTAVDVVLVFAVIVLAAVAMVAVGVVLSTLVRTRLWSTVEPLVLFAVLAVVFFPLYYVLPDVGIGIGEAAPGTVFAAAAWTVLQALFGYYAAISVTIQLYGTASAILLILVWLYVGGFVLLVGAALNAVLAGRVDPDAKWVPIDRF